MDREYQALREHLCETAAHDTPPEFVTPVVRRLAAAMGSPASAPADLAALVRHVLRRETERQRVQQTIAVPQNSRWLSADGWQDFGVDATDDRQEGQWVLSARPWRPEWLAADQAVSSPEADAYAETMRRGDARCSGDPFLQCLGHSRTYLTPGQRQAVRAALATPPGGTLLVTIPTGSGKSLCAQAISQTRLADGRERGLTVVVVPTVALAADQERAARRFTDRAFAYVGGQDASRREKNQEIRRQISAGSMDILFAAPEAVIAGPLRQSLYGAARAGGIKALVVDEAHLVEQWGDEFRSSFQQLAGLRRGLLAVSPGPPPPTLLLSATITAASFDTLRHLFGGPGPFGAAAAVNLRPEPSYWIAKCSDRIQKRQRILEAVRHTPRPAILYTSMVEDAEAWYALLLEHGFRRVRAMTGRTSQRERETIIEQWAQRSIDVIVATSAFGLGVDQAEVRTVIHACVPETADRYYQEVGRGGRDGAACLSLMLYDEQDLDAGRGLAKRKIIGFEKGFPRWDRMFRHKRTIDDERMAVDLTISPGTDRRRIDMSGSQNEEWNARTITLMARAGLLQLDDLPPSSESTTLSSHGDTGQSAVSIVRVLDANHLDEDIWREKTEAARVATQQSYRRQITLMDRILTGRECIADVLKQAYEFTAATGDRSKEIAVAPSCGGCPFCRAHGLPPRERSARLSGYPWAPELRIGEQLRGFSAGGNVWALFGDAYPDKPEARQRLFRILKWLVSQGIRLVVGPERFIDALLEAPGELIRMNVFAEHDGAGLQTIATPRVPQVLISPPGSRVDVPRAIGDRLGIPPDGRPVTVWLLPPGAVSKDKPQTPLWEWLGCRRHSFLQVEEQANL